MPKTEWIIGGAIENGAFLMALVSVLLTILGILLALGGVIAYIRVRHIAKSIAAEEAKSTAHELAEKAATAYLEAELPAIMAEYSALGQASISDNMADSIAQNQGEGR